jgi:hypothetical protein
MAYFIRAAEVWILDNSGRNLVLGSAHYGELHEDVSKVFHEASKSMRFAIDEGLPGKTWAERRPLIWTDLSVSHFKRKELIADAGLVCGLSIPIYAGEFLLGVVILFCGGVDEITGVMEIWRNRDFYDSELHLQDGYYGALEKFEYISRHLTLMRGRGLPGLAWSLASPLIMLNLAESNSFVRSRIAAEHKLTAGLAIPFLNTDRDVQVVTFLSTDTTPAAARLEIWRADSSHRYLLFGEGYCAKGTDLKALHRGKAYDRGESTMGFVWLNGRPMVEKSDDDDGAGAVYIPFIIRGVLQAVVKFVF